VITDVFYLLVAGPGLYHAITGSISRGLRASLAVLTLHAWIGWGWPPQRNTNPHGSRILETGEQLSP
jgi:hypothetical protein